MGGAGIFVLFVIHHILNLGWYKNLFQGKYTAFRIFQVSVNVLLLLSMAVLMYSGIVLSRHVLAFLPSRSGMALARRLHILGSYWGFLLMNLHLGLQWNMVIGRLKKKHEVGFRGHKAVLFLAGLVVALLVVSRSNGSP